MNLAIVFAQGQVHSVHRTWTRLEAAQYPDGTLLMIRLHSIAPQLMCSVQNVLLTLEMLNHLSVSWFDLVLCLKRGAVSL
jgi:hypothetical protein